MTSIFIILNYSSLGISSRTLCINKFKDLFIAKWLLIVKKMYTKQNWQSKQRDMTVSFDICSLHPVRYYDLYYISRHKFYYELLKF